MADRVAMITGGARGIGRGIALDLAASGWSIALCYRTSAADAEQTRAEAEAKGARALAIRADISDPAAAESFVQQVEGTCGRIDALINCAGPYQRVDIMKETPEGWRSMFANNLDPIFFLARLVAPGMIERKWGRIVTFSMANADQMVGQPNLTAHYIAKIGVLVLTRTLARTLAPHGITANAVSPGFIESGSAPAEELQAMAKRIPAGYIGDVADAVGVVRFLLSDDALYVNGANIQLSGAWGV